MKPYKLLLLDNNDSFVYNLYQYLSELYNGKVFVIKNDSISLSQVDSYDTIVLSPGPDIPSNAGIMPEVIKTYYRSKPILGVCLGHQAIYESFGGTLKNIDTVSHGIQSDITLDLNDDLFKNLNKTITVGRYHSWITDNTIIPDELLATSWDKDMNIMSISHKTLPIKGLQFHPESFMTKDGKQILNNFITMLGQNTQVNI